MNAIGEFFSRAAHWTARQTGRASTFGLACLAVVVWAASGPVFDFSETWQLVINTGTTIITFLMIFLLQHAQNRDSTAIQLKLDELIRVNQDARNKLLTLEDLTEVELEKVKAGFTTMAERDGEIAELETVREDLDRARENIDDAEERIEGARSRKAEAASRR